MANEERKQAILKAVANRLDAPGFLEELYYEADGPGGEQGVIEKALADAVASTKTQLDDIAVAALAPALAANLLASFKAFWGEAVGDSGEE